MSKKKDETPEVTTTSGKPDLRIKENREKYLVDPNLKKDGEPDNRLLENRPDLQQLHENRGDDTPNVKTD